MKSLITTALLFIILTLLNVQASPQQQLTDKLFFNGQVYDLYTYPLEEYFKENNNKPKIEVESFDLQRGYVATFEMKDGMLTLNDIQINRLSKTENNANKYVLETVKREVFGNSETIHLDWFTGLLVLPYGDILSFFHEGRVHGYSHYLLLEIKNGLLTGKRKYDFEGYKSFKNKQFTAFKTTEKYKLAVSELRKLRDNEKELDATIRRFVVYYLTEFLVD